MGEGNVEKFSFSSRDYHGSSQSQKIPGLSAELLFPDRANILLQAEDMLSSLTSSLAMNTRTKDVRETKREQQEEIERPSEILEHERQRLVEMELYRKIVERKRQLVKFGEDHGARYITYGGEGHLREIMELITKDLSEPYSIYTYRYFIYQWPKLCHLAVDTGGKVVGAIVCKMENTKGSMGHSDNIRRGYIAMLAVDENHRRKKIGTALVVSAVESLMNNACDEVVLETETTNQAALKLYENLGFARHKRLLKYYLNGVDAFRLKLWIKYPTVIRERSRVSFVETVDVSRKGP